ncbi:MAG: hypothetical protein AAGI24_08130 [Pseudomonadota bacterium]
MRVKSFGICMMLICAASTVTASHLSESEVQALEVRCENERSKKLAPKRAAVHKQCMDEGLFDAAGCDEMAQAYGNRQFGGVRRPGLYYDLPSCVEAFRAREHYTLNPGR